MTPNCVHGGERLIAIVDGSYTATTDKRYSSFLAQGTGIFTHPFTTASAAPLE